MNYCVYWIREKSHTDLMSQGYIGVSGNVKERFASHKKMWSGTNNYLCNAIKKYGWDNLDKSVLLVAEKDYCLEIERKLRPADKIGWNLTVGGGMPPVLTGPQPHLRGRPAWNKGKTGIFSEESLEKMRQAKIGVPPSNKGVPKSDEVKQRLSMLYKGRPSPMRGKKHTPEAIEKIKASKIGKRFSEEHKRKLRESAQNRKTKCLETERKEQL